MNKVNSIVICRDEYSSEEEWKNAIRDAVMVLLNNNYIMTVRYDEKGLGIVAIDFNYAEREYGDTYPYWLTTEQVDAVYLSESNDEE